MLQPVVITFEDHVIHIGKKLGIKPNGNLTVIYATYERRLTLNRKVTTRTVGHLWVIGFLSYTLWYQASYGSQIDAVQNPLVPWSIADRLRAF